MALQKLELRPGVNREATTYSNEGGYYSGDKIRFRSGFPEKIGGWENITNNGSTYKGVTRFLWNYVTLISLDLLGVFTNQKVYVELGGTYHDITPLRTTVTLTANPFSTTNGSKLITVNAVAHGVIAGTSVTFSGATAVGGLTINGQYEILTVLGTNTYTIAALSAASSTATGGGPSVVAAYDINAGPATFTTGLGWGGPPWGFGGWGSTTPVPVPMRLWSASNYGDDLIFAECEGEVYYWTADVSTWARAVTLETKANSEIKVITSATFSSGSVSLVVNDTTGISTGSVISGSGIPSGAYVTTSWDGSTSLTISSATTGSGTVSIAASYAGRHVPNEVRVIGQSSVNGFTIAFGSSPYDPTSFTTSLDPLLIRWSDLDNPYEWVPEVTNQSGEQRLSNGSYIVAAVNTRQEIVVWTDTSIYSMQYLGAPYVWGISLLASDISIISQNAAISVNNVIYWMGTDKFYQYSGRVETLPCSLRQYVYNDINAAEFAQVCCGHNEGYNEIWWFYPSENSFINDKYVVYNYLERIWYYGTLNRSAFCINPARQYPMLAFGIQGSYLAADIDDSQTSIQLLNVSTYPVPGVIYIGSEQVFYTGIAGGQLTGCVRGYLGSIPAAHTAYTPVTYKAPNQIMFHEIGNDDFSTGVAEPITSYIETSDFDIGDGYNFGYVWRILPDLNFIGSTGASPSVTLTVRPRQNSGTNYSDADSPVVTRTATVPIQQYTGQVYTRIRGRQMAFRVDSTELGVAWQMGAMRIDLRPDGRR